MPRPFSSIARALHWLNAMCVLGLMSSGWAIYNADPFFGFEFPTAVALGGYLTPALRWHFFFMWGLVFGAIAQTTLRLLLRRGGPGLFPVQPRRILQEIVDFARFRLGHEAGVYIHTQRLLYLSVFALFITVILSGFAIWKPVQFQLITESLGGYEAARRWHFWSMAGLGGFVIVHLMMVLVVPSTLLAMLFGASPNPRKSDP